MATLDRNAVTRMFGNVAAVMAENRDLLCSLDAELGDGDLGLTMSKGFAAAAREANENPETDIGRLLMRMGMKMNSAAPSTMGTLMSSGLMAAGKALTGRSELSNGDVAVFFGAFADGVAARGKASPGDRTVLDTLRPAADAVAADSGKECDTADLVRRAHEAAKAGLEATKSMPPKYGKAAVFADKALGRIDQGALAGVLFIEGMNRAFS